MCWYIVMFCYGFDHCVGHVRVLVHYNVLVRDPCAGHESMLIHCNVLLWFLIAVQVICECWYIVMLCYGSLSLCRSCESAGTLSCFV